MATKAIGGAYPSGYDLNPAYQTLEIEATATIAGAGVTTSASQSSTIDNLGVVQGAANGITLSGGGTIQNGGNGATGQVASIEGTTAIVANGTAATVVNYASIKSDPVKSGNTTTTGPSIVLNAGGKVTNTGADAVISNGISISGAAGEVVNRGMIGGVVKYQYQDSDRHSTYYGPSVALAAGGSVNNGANGNTGASLSNGVSISGGVGTVINNGTIGGQRVDFFYSPYGDYGHSSYAIEMSGGGSVRNGTGKNTSATLTSGVSITGGSGTIDNQGRIEVQGHLEPYVVAMSDGGTIVNGGVHNAGAVIAGFTEGISLKGKGTIENFGTISANRDAIIFRSSNDTLIEEGTGVLDGKVIGDGGTLILAGDAGAGSISGIGRTISGFGQITIQSGATWTLEGSTKLAQGTRFDNQGALSTTGKTFTNNGYFQTEGTFVTAGKIVNNNIFDIYGDTQAGTVLNKAGGGSIELFDNATLVAQRIVNSSEIGSIFSTSTIEGAIRNTGSIEVGSSLGDQIASVLTLTGNISGSGGNLLVDQGAVLELAGSVSAGQTVTLEGRKSTLKLDDSQDFKAPIARFTTGDRIDLADVARNGATFSFVENPDGTAGTLTVSSGTTTVALILEGSYAASHFRLLSDGNGGTEIAYSNSASSGLAAASASAGSSKAGAPAGVTDASVLEVPIQPLWDVHSILSVASLGATDVDLGAQAFPADAFNSLGQASWAAAMGPDALWFDRMNAGESGGHAHGLDLAAASGGERGHL